MKNYTFPFDIEHEIDKETEAYLHDSSAYRARFAQALDKVYDDARRAARRVPLPGYGDNVFALGILRAVRKANDENQ